MKKTQSPSYPSFGLGKAVDLVGKVYSGAHQTRIDPKMLFKLLGYKSESGASLAASASLKRFGLLEGRGSEIRVSGLAMKFLRPLNEDELGEGAIEAAKEPEIFQELLRLSEDGSPPSDEVLSAYLERKFGFHPKGAKSCVRAFRDTLEYVESLNGSLVGLLNVGAQQANADEAETVHLKEGAYVSTVEEDTRNKTYQGTFGKIGDNEEVLRFRLSADSAVEISFDGRITRNSIERLVALLELSKDTYPLDE